MAEMGKLNEELKKEARKEAMKATNDPLRRVQAAFLARGASGIKGAQLRFKIMDDDGSKTLSFDEFAKGIRDVGVVMDDQGMMELFNLFDRDNEGTINFDEFLITITPPMNKRRRNLVEAAYKKLDKTGDGLVTVADIAKGYNATKHPKYLSGEWTETKVYQEYLKTFEAEDHADGTVTPEEFLSYYASIGCSIDNDAYFDLMMRNSWGDLVV